MNDSDKRFKERWDSIRNGGRIRYALVHGAGFGFAVFVIINLWYLNDKSFSEVYLNQRAFEQMLTMVFAGILGYGTIKWWMNEKIYRKIENNENKKP
ncbi:MAG: hypothetical protein IPL63_08060 [Saprospiraceae bacterium]|nr:hypothetical protein [Saprospiraceae bacterium]MBK6564306.1 hypothetical protein [Saprospiraceae bacterium]MBK6782477.1 hypothetical protein [Saprospiraceae bacterium]MBK7524011.1 hypothetical protein [Saprospiraceae bacterium]MBK8372065.1 hypothetical protein [Saprospiraceae bacterium]